MKNFVLLLSILCIGHFSFSQEDKVPIWALKQGTVGIGIQPSLNLNKFGLGTGFGSTYTRGGLGVIGLYSMRDLLTFQAGIGFGCNVNKYGSGATASSNRTEGFNFGIGALVPLRIYETNDINFVISPNIGVILFNGNNVNDTPGLPVTKSPTSNLQFDLGIKTELFLSHFFSIQTPASLSINFVATSIEKHGDSDYQFALFNSSPETSLNFLTSTVGFHYYFF